MMELFLLLIVIQGDTSEEWIQSCNDQFNSEIDFFTPINKYDPNNQEHKDYIFCRIIDELELNEHQVELLGRDIDWYNYANQTAYEFVDGSDFYQKVDNVTIEPVVSGRDSLPPPMSVVISYDEIYRDLEKSKFYKIYNVNPRCNPEVYDTVCHTDVLSATPKRDTQYDINNANYKIHSELNTNLFFKNSVDTKFYAIGPHPYGILVSVYPKYLDTYQLFRYQDTFREIIGPDVPILFEEFKINYIVDSTTGNGYNYFPVIVIGIGAVIFAVIILKKKWKLGFW